MQIIKQDTNIDFLGKRRIMAILSIVLVVVGLVSLFVRGLNFGIEFTGGTLVEVEYDQPVSIADTRATLVAAEFGDAVVQYFGTSRDIAIRLPVREDADSAQISSEVLSALRAPDNEVLVEGAGGRVQRCSRDGSVVDCRVQMRRIEFIGPQFGKELAEDGGLALLAALFMILLYVAFRFEWKFAIGAVVALAHDVLIALGVFSLLQLEFNQSVLAALLAVIGYSLNDTIVVFDRIRENFRKMRKGSTFEIMNKSINQTLRRTLLTSLTTLLVLLALFFLGGEVIHGFATALIIGVLVGTYSSIFVASPVVLGLGISRDDMMPVKKEGVDQESLLP
ncbi:MAG: protein translocase subunit SecF [Gammaproteobacteria bacterium]|nr:protein translocase subunit SecF [Gammaproteobacteria bacterium]